MTDAAIRSVRVADGFGAGVDSVDHMLEGIEAMDDAMRASGHYGRRVEVAADADAQARLLAFTGRHP